MRKLLFLLCLLLVFTACNDVTELKDLEPDGIPDDTVEMEFPVDAQDGAQDTKPEADTPVLEDSPPYIPPGVEVSDGTDGIPIRDPASERMGAFMDYLLSNLTFDDYGSMVGLNNKYVEIYYINREKIEAVVEAYGPVDIEVHYYEAKYSKSVVDAIAEELNQQAFVKERGDLMSLYGDALGIHIYAYVENVEEDFPELLEWVDASQYKDMIRISDYLSMPKPYPN